MEYLNEIINWIKEKVIKANASGVIVGISGGIDSALVAYLAKEAFPNNSLGILMPIIERKNDLDDGIKLVKKINLDYKIINLNSIYNQCLDLFKLKNKNAINNLQARLRMSTLYALAQENNYLVLGTDNAAEYYLGYFTKFGDGACDLLPIVYLQKSQIYEYAKKLKLPNEIISKPPSAGFYLDHEDEKELGFTYNDFENFILNKNIDKNIKNKIIKQHKITNHKRKLPPKPPKPFKI